MSVWGIGSYYKGSKPKDVTSNFLANGYAYIGWSKNDAPSIYQMFDSIKLGDIIYIKSYARKYKSLNIKAVGIVTDTNKFQNSNLGTGISVKWNINFKPFSIPLTAEIYKNNVFNNTLYEEFNQDIIQKLINSLF